MSRKKDQQDENKECEFTLKRQDNITEATRFETRRDRICTDEMPENTERGFILECDLGYDDYQKDQEGNMVNSGYQPMLEECFRLKRTPRPDDRQMEFERFLTELEPTQHEGDFTIRFKHGSRRLASDHHHVDTLPVHQEPALPAPSTVPFLTSLLLLLFVLLAGVLAFRCLRRSRAKPRRDSLVDHLRENPLNRAERI